MSVRFCRLACRFLLTRGSGTSFGYAPERWTLGVAGRGALRSPAQGALLDRDIRLANDAAVFIELPLHVGAELRAARANWKEFLLGKLGRHVGGLSALLNQPDSSLIVSGGVFAGATMP